MSDTTDAAGLAALSICESLLLSLTENKIIDGAEARSILRDAEAAHRAAGPPADGAAGRHEEAAAILASMVETGDSVRLRRPTAAGG